MTPKQLRFGLLEPLQMRTDAIVVPLGTAKKRAVLALLLMNRNRPVAVDSLLTAASEEMPPSGERANIHSYMSNLRRLLNSLGVDGKAVPTKVAPSYAINVDDTDVDLGSYVAVKTAAVHAAADGLF